MVPLLVPDEVALLLRPVVAVRAGMPYDVDPVLACPVPLHRLGEACAVAAAWDGADSDYIAPLVALFAVSAESAAYAVLGGPGGGSLGGRGRGRGERWKLYLRR